MIERLRFADEHALRDVDVALGVQPRARDAARGRRDRAAGADGGRHGRHSAPAQRHLYRGERQRRWWSAAKPAPATTASSAFGHGGGLISSRVVDRTATFVFFLGDRFFGTVTAYVPGPDAERFISPARSRCSS